MVNYNVAIAASACWPTSGDGVPILGHPLLYGSNGGRQLT
jgi:hypothetical protein